MADFTELARAALEQADVPVADGDLDVLGMVSRAFDPAMRLLDAADLKQLPLEPDLDPSRAPRARS
jgi:hypothetical protein